MGSWAKDLQAAFRIQKISIGTYGEGETYEYSGEINEINKDNLDLVYIWWWDKRDYQEWLLGNLVENSRRPYLKLEDYDFLFGTTENELSFMICKRKCQVGHGDYASES